MSDEAKNDGRGGASAQPQAVDALCVKNTWQQEALRLRAEVAMLRGVGCNEDGDGSCGACLKCAIAGRHVAQSTLNKRVAPAPDGLLEDPIRAASFRLLEVVAAVFDPDTLSPAERATFSAAQKALDDAMTEEHERENAPGIEQWSDVPRSSEAEKGSGHVVDDRDRAGGAAGGAGGGVLRGTMVGGGATAGELEGLVEPRPSDASPPADASDRADLTLKWSPRAIRDELLRLYEIERAWRGLIATRAEQRAEAGRPDTTTEQRPAETPPDAEVRELLQQLIATVRSNASSLRVSIAARKLEQSIRADERGRNEATLDLDTVREVEARVQEQLDGAAINDATRSVFCAVRGVLKACRAAAKREEG